MTEAKSTPVHIQLKLYHILIWLLFLLFSGRYFTVGTPGTMAWAMAIITTVISIVTFYVPYNLFTANTKSGKLTGPVAAAIVFVILISFCETILELAAQRFFLGNSRQWFFMGRLFTNIFFVSFVLLVAITIRLAGNRYLEKERLDAVTKEKLSAELAFLKSQLHPHFLFNIHNTIYFLINENPLLAAKMVLKLSSIMRYQLHDCQVELISLNKELHHISNYIALEKIRLGDKVKVTYDFLKVSADIRIAPLLLIPLVENAFKHISHDINVPNFINIIAGFNKKYFYFTVTNTFEKYQREQGTGIMLTGIGLKNLRRRLILAYGDTFELNFNEQGNEYTALLKLPLL